MIRTIDSAKAYMFGAKWLTSWALVNWNYTMGLRSPRGRSVVYAISNQLGLESLGRKKAELPKVTCEDILPKLNAQVLSPEPIDGNVSLLELLILCTMAKTHQIRSAFEIGTFNGRTALNLALNMPPDGNVYTLDLPADQASGVAGEMERGNLHYVRNHTPGELFEKHGRTNCARITQLLGDSATFDYSPYRSGMDLVFIDGAHSYDYVKRDTEAALTLLRDGHGLIFWHDYDACLGVIDWVDELNRRHPEYQAKHIAGTKLAYMVK
jgi:predicted O-methyltransferase YrrM